MSLSGAQRAHIFAQQIEDVVQGSLALPFPYHKPIIRFSGHLPIFQRVKIKAFLTGARRDDNRLPTAGVISINARSKHKHAGVGFFSQIFLVARNNSARVADENSEFTLDNHVDPGCDTCWQFHYALRPSEKYLNHEILLSAAPAEFKYSTDRSITVAWHNSGAHQQTRLTSPRRASSAIRLSSSYVAFLSFICSHSQRRYFDIT
jgi:hypothetical protein